MAKKSAPKPFVPRTYPITVRELAAFAEGVAVEEIRWNTPPIAAAYTFCQNPANGVEKQENSSGVMVFAITKEQAHAYRDARQARLERKAAREAAAAEAEAEEDAA